MPQFATITDLEARWRTLTSEERSRASILIEDGSALIAAECKQSGIDVLEVDQSILKAITCAMVKRAMMTPIDRPPIESEQTSAGPYSQSYNYTNPTGDLYLTARERKLLGIGKARVFGVAPKIGGGRSDG